MCGSRRGGASPTLLLRENRSLSNKAIMKVELKPIIDALKHGANQLEHHAQKLRTTSPNLKAEAGEIGDRVRLIRSEIEVLQQWK